MEAIQPIFSFKIGSIPIDIYEEVVVQWVVILVLGIISYLLTRNLKRNPDKKQVVLETVYEKVETLVLSNMGESYTGFIPYIGSLMVYLLVLNFLGLIGVKPPTQNINVTLALAITSFAVINFNAIKRNGIGHYLGGYTHPFLAMLPLNIMERVMLPVSLCLRLFGNMVAATLLLELLYKALGHVGFIAQIGLPVFAHGYFDLFDGTIQMIVFTMLTMINIKMTAEH